MLPYTFALKTSFLPSPLGVNAVGMNTPVLHCFAITVVEKTNATVDNTNKLFFINLGGYKQGEFDEFHYKMLIVASGKDAAIAKAKQTAFYKHTGFKGAPSHIDDKYGVDVDDVFEIKDILPKALKQKYCIAIQPSLSTKEDDMHLGYFKLDTL